MKQKRPRIEPDRASGASARRGDGSARSTDRGTSSRCTSTSRHAGGILTFLPVNDTQRSLDARVVAYIRDLIEPGQLTAGDRLPPERELAVQLNVSRTVLREALHTLAALGLVELQHGRGIFVTSGSAQATAQRLSASMQADDSAARLRDLFAIRHQPRWAVTCAVSLGPPASIRRPRSRHHPVHLAAHPHLPGWRLGGRSGCAVRALRSGHTRLCAGGCIRRMTTRTVGECCFDCARGSSFHASGPMTRRGARSDR